MTKVTITLPADDVEPWLRQAAREAAKYSAWLDYITPKTHNNPRGSYWKTHADWRTEHTKRFLRAKRIVEAFGVEYEQTSEEETLTVAYRWVGGTTKVKNIPGIGPVGWRTGTVEDLKHPYPSYRGEVHSQACNAAADRVVQRWREGLARQELSE